MSFTIMPRLTLIHSGHVFVLVGNHVIGFGVFMTQIDQFLFCFIKYG